MEISTKTHLLEISTMIHVVRKQIKCILVNERSRDISLARLRDHLPTGKWLMFKGELNPKINPF